MVAVFQFCFLCFLLSTSPLPTCKPSSPSSNCPQLSSTDTDTDENENFFTYIFEGARAGLLLRLRLSLLFLKDLGHVEMQTLHIGAGVGMGVGLKPVCIFQASRDGELLVHYCIMPSSLSPSHVLSLKRTHKNRHITFELVGLSQCIRDLRRKMG